MCRDPDQELPKESQASFQSTFNIQFNDFDCFLFNRVVEHMTGRNRFKINTTHNLHFKSNTTAELGPAVPTLHRIIAQGAHISTDWLL